ncbi:MAG: MFS transporter [Rhodospirillaceae bacterium]|nr:MFS transporter [Rhodospirillaceae bacterium]
MSTIVERKSAENSWVLGLICGGHFFSHFVMLSLPPLFLFMKPELQVSYAALGAIVSAFAATTAVGQIPAGILVDRFGARYVLIGGIGIISICLVLSGLSEGYWPLFIYFLVAGIGNSVFHPADFSILSARLDKKIFGRAVSIHSFMGYLGWAGASLFILPLAKITNWHTALFIVGLVGLALTIVMVVQSHLLNDRKEEADIASENSTPKLNFRENISLMFSLPLVMMSLFYLLTAMATAGIMSFSIVANVAFYGVTTDFAGGMLTAHLIALSVGVLIGGWLADLTERHNFVAGIGIVCMALSILCLAYEQELVLVMIIGMLLSGLFYGISSPSRDLLTRKSAPEGSAGVAFGFTSTGMSIGNLVGPVLFGWMMDFNQPRLYFITLGLVVAISVIAVVFTRHRQLSFR